MDFGFERPNTEQIKGGMKVMTTKKKRERKICYDKINVPNSRT